MNTNVSLLGLRHELQGIFPKATVSVGVTMWFNPEREPQHHQDWNASVHQENCMTHHIHDKPSAEALLNVFSEWRDALNPETNAEQNVTVEIEPQPAPEEIAS